MHRPPYTNLFPNPVPEEHPLAPLYARRTRHEHGIIIDGGPRSSGFQEALILELALITHQYLVFA
jgi:hypothetical protein